MKTLDETYEELNGIYLDANFYKDEFQVFAHLVEVVGGLSSIASEKKDKLEEARRYMPKAIAWWLALAGKVGVTSVRSMLWVKYPNVCPYCALEQHQDDKCKGSDPALDTPQWELLKSKGQNIEAPQTITEWQAMFRTIYPVQKATSSMERTFARLTEELGELGEAIRVRRIAPDYFISEAADVFAWLMHVQNWYDLVTGKQNGTLEDWIEEAYPGRCTECMLPTCACPAILDSAFGRMAHSIPNSVIPKALIPIDDSIERFHQRTITWKGRTHEFEPGDLRDLQRGVNEIIARSYNDQDLQGFQNQALMDILYELKWIRTTSAIDSTTIQRLSDQLALLSPSTRSEIEGIAKDFGTNLFSFLFLTAVTYGSGLGS